MAGRLRLGDRIDQARERSRAKLYRLVRQAVEESGLAQAQAALASRIDQLDHLLRRDIDYAGQIVSAREASAFVLEHMPNAKAFPHPHDTLRYALQLAPPEGMSLEFGVAAGNTLRVITGLRPPGTVFGFDSFEGFPEDWRTGFPKGTFAMDPPDVPGAELVKGWFSDTLPSFLEDHPGPVAFVHADGDLYSSTVTILDCLRDRLAPGTVIQFDEYFNWPGWRNHEHRAWTEFVDKTGVRYEYEAYSADHEQVVVRIV